MSNVRGYLGGEGCSCTLGLNEKRRAHVEMCR